MNGRKRINWFLFILRRKKPRLRMSIKSNRYVILLLTGFSSLVQAAPLANLSSSSLDFDVQPINTVSAARTVTLSNTGDQSLNITAIQISGEFSLGATYACYNTASACAKPALPCTSLAPGTGCTFNVWYTPVKDPALNQTQRNSAIGSLQFTTNAADSIASVALIGTTANIACNVASIAPIKQFDPTAIGAASAAQSILITAGATALPLAISANGDFSWSSDDCSSSLPANSSCTVKVTFNPTIFGARTGNIYFNNRSHICGFADATLQGNGTGTNLSSPPAAGVAVNTTLPTQADPNAGTGNDPESGDTTTNIKGCTMGNGGFDPVLILLLLAALFRLSPKRMKK
jgi:hypothetical protein